MLSIINSRKTACPLILAGLKMQLLVTGHHLEENQLADSHC